MPLKTEQSILLHVLLIDNKKDLDYRVCHKMTQMQLGRIMKAQPALGDKFPVGMEMMKIQATVQRPNN